MRSRADHRPLLGPAQHRFAADADLRRSTDGLDDANELRGPVDAAVSLVARCEIDDADRAARRLDRGLEDVGVIDVGLTACRAVSRGDSESAAIGIEQLAEDRLAVEPGQTTPDDIAARVNQRGELAIAN